MNTSIISAECFICGAYDEADVKDCFIMPFKDDTMRSGYLCIAPTNAPSTLFVPVQEGLDLLRMYTSDLTVLQTPQDKCLQKALELIEDYENHALNISIFRHDLTQTVMDCCAFDEVDALINGICALVEYLRDCFNRHGLFIGNTLAYVYDCFVEPGTLVMTKFMYYNGDKQSILSNQTHPLHSVYSSAVAILPLSA